jgi:hypothetical protein
VVGSAPIGFLLSNSTRFRKASTVGCLSRGGANSRTIVPMVTILSVGTFAAVVLGGLMSLAMLDSPIHQSLPI